MSFYGPGALRGPSGLALAVSAVSLPIISAQPPLSAKSHLELFADT